MSQEIPTFFHFVFYHLLLSLFILSFLPSLCKTPVLHTALWSYPLFCSLHVSISLSHSVSWSLLPTYSEYVGCTKMSASWESTDEMKTQQFRQDRKIKCKLFLCPFWPPPSSRMSPLSTRRRWKNLLNHKDQFFFSIFSCKEHNQSDFGIEHLVMSLCRVVSCYWKRVCQLKKTYNLRIAS